MRIFKYITGFIICMLGIGCILCCVMVFGIKHWKNGAQKKIIATADDLGYQMQYEDDLYTLSEDGIEYSYKWILGKLYLYEIYTEQEPITDFEVDDNIGKLTITRLRRNKVDVTLRYVTTTINNQGTELTFESIIGFVCSPEFTVESIDPHDGVSILGKAEKYHHTITHNFIPEERLREIYERGEEIATEINDGMK